ncbi:lysozyme inhibitor LprI family protein [Paraburkholderia sediminicola]|uniref:lysozyme inhibitor LprI family protein n=1 Tax=Paraburkholderia sediminicola TaxID=458836 RepID=UPI0038BC17A0
MLKRLLGAILAIALIALVGCGEQKKQEEPSLLQDISGVWKENTSNSLMTLQYADKKVRMLVDDEFIPVNAGAIDNENHTANLNVVIAATGKPAVWTIRQVWNADKSAFHLQLTLHDGTQSEFSFVRKISTDDLNHIASLEAPVKSENSAQAAAAAATQPAQTEQQTMQQPAQEATHAMQQEAQPMTVSAPATGPAVMPAPVTPVAATTTAPAQTDSGSAAQTTAFAPSFDCRKVTSGPERLICSSPQLSALDVELGQSYKRQMELTDNKKELKADQIEWRKKERDACSTAECIAQAYRSRIDDLDAVSSHLSKPAGFK